MERKKVSKFRGISTYVYETDYVKRIHSIKDEMYKIIKDGHHIDPVTKKVCVQPDKVGLLVGYCLSLDPQDAAKAQTLLKAKLKQEGLLDEESNEV